MLLSLLLSFQKAKTKLKNIYIIFHLFLLASIFNFNYGVRSRFAVEFEAIVRGQLVVLDLPVTVSLTSCRLSDLNSWFPFQGRFHVLYCLYHIRTSSDNRNYNLRFIFGFLSYFCFDVILVVDINTCFDTLWFSCVPLFSAWTEIYVMLMRSLALWWIL